MLLIKKQELTPDVLHPIELPAGSDTNTGNQRLCSQPTPAGPSAGLWSDVRVANAGKLPHSASAAADKELLAALCGLAPAMPPPHRLLMLANMNRLKHNRLTEGSFVRVLLFFFAPSNRFLLLSDARRIELINMT